MKKKTPLSNPLPLSKTTLFSLLPVFFLLASFEIILRLFGFQYSPTALEMRMIVNNPHGVVSNVLFWDNREGVIRMVKDAKQHWVPKDSPLTRYPLKKPDGALRISTLGCSCTAGCTGTNTSYPALLEELLNGQGQPKVEVLNAGVGSYSTYQGLQRFKYAVLPYQPDILTVFFGWNDHWVTGTPDKSVRLESDFEIGLINFFENFRVFQFFNSIHGKILKKQREQKTASFQIRLRVPVADYLQNLVDIVRIARQHHIRPVLVTAPQEIHEWGKSRLQLMPGSKEELLKTHARYNDTVRMVAEKLNVELIDLEKIVREAPAGSVISEDGIHFHEGGCHFVAQKFAEYLRQSTPRLQKP